MKRWKQDGTLMVRRQRLAAVWAVGRALGAAGYEAVWWERSGKEPPVRDEVEISVPHEVSPSMQERLAQMLLVATANQREMSEEDGRKVVRMLHSNPDRINSLWLEMDSEGRPERISAIFTKLAQDCPEVVWKLVSRMKFPPVGVPQLTEALKTGAAVTPLQALRGLGWRRYEQEPEIIAVVVKDRRGAGAVLDMIRSGDRMPDRPMMALFDTPDFWTLNWKNLDRLSQRPSWQEYYEQKLRERSALAWLSGAEMPREEIGKLTPFDLHNILARAEQIRPDCLEILAGVHPIKLVREIPPMLVRMGKTVAAVELVKGLKGAPVVGEEWEGMMERVVKTMRPPGIVMPAWRCAMNWRARSCAG
jgi:hypothetical protein